MKLVKGLAVPLIVASLAGCGGDTVVTPPVTTLAPARAVIGVLIDPNPVIAVPSGDSDFPWDFRFNLQVSDSGGVGFIVTSMLTTITSAQSGATLISTDANAFVGVAIAARGQETRQFHMGPYRMENLAKDGRANIRMNFVDDRGNASVFDGSVNIRYADAPVRMN